MIVVGMISGKSASEEASVPPPLVFRQITNPDTLPSGVPRELPLRSEAAAARLTHTQWSAEEAARHFRVGGGNGGLAHGHERERRVRQVLARDEAGQNLARLLDKEDISFIALDSDPQRVREADRAGDVAGLLFKLERMQQSVVSFRRKVAMACFTSSVSIWATRSVLTTMVSPSSDVLVSCSRTRTKPAV